MASYVRDFAQLHGKINLWLAGDDELKRKIDARGIVNEMAQLCQGAFNKTKEKMSKNETPEEATDRFERLMRGVNTFQAEVEQEYARMRQEDGKQDDPRIDND